MGDVGDDVPRVGVSIAALDAFAAAVAPLAPSGSTALLSTDDVSRLAKEHLTRERQCAYTDLLRGDPSLVGDATVFVSHAWGMRFDELVAALRDFDCKLREQEPARTPFFWVDVLVNNQHFAPVERGFAWWQTTFRDSVERIGRTVVVLEWERPRPLERTWCLWEIFCTVHNRGGLNALELALPLAARAAFARAVEHDFDAVVKKVEGLDLRSADAYHGGGCLQAVEGGAATCAEVLAKRLSACPDDKRKILDAVEASGGVAVVADSIRGALWAWMVAELRRALCALPELAPPRPGLDDRASSNLQLGLGRLLHRTGKLAEARALLLETVEARRRWS
jgi:hypothetical protein